MNRTAFQLFEKGFLCIKNDICSINNYIQDPSCSIWKTIAFHPSPHPFRATRTRRTTFHCWGMLLRALVIMSVFRARNQLLFTNKHTWPQQSSTRVCLLVCMHNLEAISARVTFTRTVVASPSLFLIVICLIWTGAARYSVHYQPRRWTLRLTSDLKSLWKPPPLWY